MLVAASDPGFPGKLLTFLDNGTSEPYSAQFFSHQSARAAKLRSFILDQHCVCHIVQEAASILVGGFPCKPLKTVRSQMTVTAVQSPAAYGVFRMTSSSLISQGVGELWRAYLSARLVTLYRLFLVNRRYSS